MSLTETIKHSRRKAQVPFAKKAAALKAASKSKQPQHPWLKINGTAPPRETLPPPTAPVNEAHRSQGPPRRLMAKAEVLATVGCTYPTLWTWMRAGTFPRSRVVGGKSMWLSSDLEQWLAALPLRKLKGDV